MDNNYFHDAGNKTIPIYGTTIYIGEVPLETIYGTFIAKTYQDIIHKGYIVSLVFGDLKGKDPLYTRMHSSCITSECLRSTDCDCVEQLEGALQKISQKGSGILFYLLQEGRGTGYVQKSRGMMLTQYTEKTDKQITTFDAYHQMGMKKDYRDYRNIKHICHILGILDKQFVLITNNPDKIDGFKQQGLNLLRIESIDIPPNPFNMAYLKSKLESGHILQETKKKQPSIYSIPYDKVEPFSPFALKNLERFIVVSSYYLPIKPIQGMLYFNQTQYDILMEKMSVQDKSLLKTELVGARYIVKFPNPELIQKYGQLTVKPWWFKAHVFYDVAHSTDYIVLTHELGLDDIFNIEPIVRIQSESILDRFPLSKKEYKNRYKETLKSIIRRGKGLIMILYNDGRGTGLGHKILDLQGIESGIAEESRDFDAVSLLLKVFVQDKPFQLFGGLTSYRALKLSLAKNGLNPTSYTLFDKEKVELSKIKQNIGIESLKTRIDKLEEYLKVVNIEMSNTKFPVYKSDDIVYVTGVGTSEAHARFLEHIAPRFIFKSIQQLSEMENIKTFNIILFSQGLSPNIGIIVEKCSIQKLTVVTTIHNDCQKTDRLDTLKRLIKDGAHIITYKEEIPDNTLIRIQGPAAGYIVSLYIKNSISGSQVVYTPKFQRPSKQLVSDFIRKKQIMFVVQSEFLSLVANIAMKFLQGAFSEPAVFCDQISFSHGYYQYALKKKLPIVFVGDVKKGFKNFVEKNSLSEQLQTSGILTIIQLDIFCNYLIMEYIEHYHIDQLNWEGKDTNTQMYNVRKYSDL